MQLCHGYCVHSLSGISRRHLCTKSPQWINNSREARVIRTHVPYRGRLRLFHARPKMRLKIRRREKLSRILNSRETSLKTLIDVVDFKPDDVMQRVSSYLFIFTSARDCRSFLASSFSMQEDNGTLSLTWKSFAFLPSSIDILVATLATTSLPSLFSPPPPPPLYPRLV